MERGALPRASSVRGLGDAFEPGQAIPKHAAPPRAHALPRRRPESPSDDHCLKEEGMFITQSEEPDIGPN